MKNYDTLVLCLSSSKGGMELDAIKMAVGLNENNHKTLLLCKKNSFIADVSKRKRVDHKEVVLRLGFIFDLRNILKKYKVKNLIFFGTSEIKYIYFSLLWFRKINFIVRYGTTRKTSKKNLIHKILYSKVDVHLAISEHLNKNISNIIPIAKHSRKIVIYTSTKFQDFSADKDIRKAVHVGRVASGKGQLEAVEAIVGTDIKLDFIGTIEDEDYFNQVKRKIEDLGLSSSVRFLGFHENPQELIKKAAFFIFPSAGEGLANSFVEALGHGLICLALNNTVFPEFKKMGFNIHLVKDENELNARLKYIIDNLQSEKLKAFYNVELARELFSPKDEYEKILSILV